MQTLRFLSSKPRPRSEIYSALVELVKNIGRWWSGPYTLAVWVSGAWEFWPGLSGLDAISTETCFSVNGCP